MSTYEFRDTLYEPVGLSVADTFPPFHETRARMHICEVGKLGMGKRVSDCHSVLRD